MEFLVSFIKLKYFQGYFCFYFHIFTNSVLVIMLFINISKSEHFPCIKNIKHIVKETDMKGYSAGFINADKHGNTP